MEVIYKYECLQSEQPDAKVMDIYTTLDPLIPKEGNVTREDWTYTSGKHYQTRITTDKKQEIVLHVYSDKDKEPNKVIVRAKGITIEEINNVLNQK